MTANPLLYRKVALSILRDLRGGSLQPGQLVPSEAQLSARFSVSRITSRKALDVLAQYGVVERQRGRGTFVADPLPDLDALGQHLDPLQDLRPAEKAAGRGRGAVELILPDFSENYGLHLVYAVEEACAEANLDLILRRTYGRREVEEEAVQTALSSGVSGLIVFPVHGEHYNPTLVKAVLDGHPVALVDRYLPGIPVPAVCTDNTRAAQALTTRLLDLGHENIAFLSPPVTNTTSIEQRFEGFRDALAARGLPFRPELQLAELFSTLPRRFESENVAKDQARLREFLQALPEVTAFFVSEYNLAIALVQVLELAGYRVPDDYSVVCFDSPGNPLGLPRFTHVHQNEGGMGRTAVHLVLDQIAGKPVPNLTRLEFEILEGRSTAPLAARAQAAPAAQGATG
ncbi:MAG TPA: GntR family transcriptional regulator [Deinococcales bacterium]|nr:GntR family transcriptional regulator [Deinococcales bacterium]